MIRKIAPTAASPTILAHLIYPSTRCLREEGKVLLPHKLLYRYFQMFELPLLLVYLKGRERFRLPGWIWPVYIAVFTYLGFYFAAMGDRQRIGIIDAPVKAKRHQIENNAAQYGGNRAPVYGKQPRKLGAVMIGARNPSVDPQDSAFSNGVKNRPDAGKRGHLLPYRNAALAAGLPNHTCAIQQRQEQEIILPGRRTSCSFSA